MKERRPTVVLCDDHPIVSMSVQIRLETRGFHVLAAVPNAGLATAVCRAKRPDLLLMDIVMPGPDPFDAVVEIARHSSGTRILFLSGFPRDSLIDRALACGAAGFITKSEDFESLVIAMRHVLSGGEYRSPEVEQRLIRLSGKPAQSRLSTLSPREREMLRHLAEDRDPQQIGKLTGITPRQVQRYDRRIRGKLGIRGPAGLARFALQEGLLGGVPDDPLPAARPSAAQSRSSPSR
ncbi:MAG TPA: response regulator transcription factor [Pirellulales bacterium]|nr:response regulator transcription factor [Pirellulales bacterium]